MSYTHFTLKERIFLYDLLNEGKTIRYIAKCLNRNPSSVSREISRNSIDGKYTPFLADREAEARKHISSLYAIKPHSKEWSYITKHLNNYWSPEAICGRWHKNFPGRKKIHFSTIYRYIERGLFPDITPRTHLRRRGKQRQPADRSKFNSVQPDRIIPEWPSRIKNRTRIGDWEGDTILGGVGKGLAITLVDRKSRYLIGTISHTKAAEPTRKKIASILTGHRVKSISFDNGVEFSDFRNLEKDLNTTIYFAEPHKPWQRGSNENTNDLLRFFFPKGCNFKEISEKEFQEAINLINNRPRKCLGWKTPAEVYKRSVALA